MWNEIFAEIGADVNSSISKKDDKGFTRTIKPTNPVSGDLLDDTSWAKAMKGGAAITEKVKDENGATRTRSAKEATGKQAEKAFSKLLGIKLKRADASKEGTASEEDTKLEGATV
jgi:hypothetical protein